jgi:hypothetical protein
MATLKRRVEEMERLRPWHHRGFAAKYPGCIISPKGVIVVLPHPRPEPENRTVVQTPADGTLEGDGG